MSGFEIAILLVLALDVALNLYIESRRKKHMDGIHLRLLMLENGIPKGQFMIQEQE